MTKTATPVTSDITIQGYVFPVSTPYAEGHPCTEAEAKALNQTRHENVRNNMARVVKAVKGDREEISEEEFAQLQAEVTEYDNGYKFTMASVGGGRKSVDPIEAEAKKIARNAIIAKLKTQGRTLKSVTDAEGGKDTLAAAVAKLAAQKAIIAAATKAIKERSELANMALGDLDI